ncbi:hypothetical protein H0H93_007551, partial [Arthromyces matolae]
ELHNLERVQHLVEWGQITKDQKTVYYILMHYMGMTYDEFLKEHPILDRAGGEGYFLKRLDEAYNEHLKNGMEHNDVHPANLAFYYEETVHGKRETCAELIDWEWAKDLWHITPTSLDDVDLKKWERVIEDNKMGIYSCKRETT